MVGSQGEVCMSAFAGSANGSIKSSWSSESVQGQGQFEKIHIIIATLPIENWLNIHQYSGTLNNTHLGLPLVN
jgi:hypothetical protein